MNAPKKKERKNYLVSNFFVQAFKSRECEDNKFRKNTMKNFRKTKFEFEFELEASDIAEIKSVAKTKFKSVNELTNYRNRLDDLRNDFAHGNISEEEFSHIKQEIKKLFDKYQDFIKIQDS